MRCSLFLNPVYRDRNWGSDKFNHQPGTRQESEPSSLSLLLTNVPSFPTLASLSHWFGLSLVCEASGGIPCRSLSLPPPIFLHMLLCLMSYEGIRWWHSVYLAISWALGGNSHAQDISLVSPRSERVQGFQQSQGFLHPWASWGLRHWCLLLCCVLSTQPGTRERNLPWGFWSGQKIPGNNNKRQREGSKPQLTAVFTHSWVGEYTSRPTHRGSFFLYQLHPWTNSGWFWCMGTHTHARMHYLQGPSNFAIIILCLMGEG